MTNMNSTAADNEEPIGRFPSVGVVQDIDLEHLDKTSREFILDDSGGRLDSLFQAYRQGSHVVLHVFSLGGSGLSKRGQDMREGKVIALRRIKNQGFKISAILTANAGMKIRNSNPPKTPQPAECIVRIGEGIDITEPVEDWARALWKEAAPVAASGANNTDRPLLFFLASEREPGVVLDTILNRNTSDVGNRVPPTPRGRKPRGPSKEREVADAGWVYIIRNHSWPGWLKIGMTSNLENRMKSYRTYEPHDLATFEYVHHFESDIAYSIEQDTHAYLDSWLAGDESNSTRRGEWYRISVEQATHAIKRNWPSQSTFDG